MAGDRLAFPIAVWRRRAYTVWAGVIVCVCLCLCMCLCVSECVCLLHVCMCIYVHMCVYVHIFCLSAGLLKLREACFCYAHVSIFICACV